jgi:hypothetical protein
MKALFNQLAARIERAIPAMQAVTKTVGVSLAAQPDCTRLAEMAEHIVRLTDLGFQVIDMDIRGEAPVFSVRPIPRPHPVNDQEI